MEKNYFYVVYDLNDNIICYLHNKIEFCLFTGIRSCDANYRFKISNTNYIVVRVFHKNLKVYRYCC